MPLAPEQRKFLIAIVGPTGTGKTSLAIQLAEGFKGEIVNADSRQFYRFMDIGTAKPTRLEMQKVPHHLFDFLDPDQTFSLGEYLVAARQKIDEIQSRGGVPFLVGGTGQYVSAVLEGWIVPNTAPDSQLRKRLERTAVEDSPEALHEELRRIDPVSAANIDKRNVRRVIRALEVTLTTGKPFSQLRLKEPTEFTSNVIGLTAGRLVLYERLDARVEEMLRQGLVKESQDLLQHGYDFGLPALNSVGYKQIGRYLRGEVSYDEAVQQIKFENHRLVRRQYAWFRLSDRNISWFDIQGDIQPEVARLLSDWLDED